MAKPKDTLWPLKRHTLAKHQLLIGYLDAWIGIVGSRFERLLLVDGFAGPGEYEGGEHGSPLRMLHSYLERADRSKLKAFVDFVFIEADPSRAAHLESLVPKPKDGERWRTKVVPGDFNAYFADGVKRYREAHPKAAVFVFVDPFGAGDKAAELATEVVAARGTEVLIYVPTNFLNRFATHPDFEQTMDKLYGGRDRWVKARDIEPGPKRRQFLQDAFADRLKRSCEFVRFFEIKPADGGNSYTLFFGTNHEKGLEKMKDSMWDLDPAGGAAFEDSTNVDHPVLFDREAGPDYAQLEAQLREKFGAKHFSIEQAERFVLVNTAFRVTKHLRTVLRDAEEHGRLEVVRAKPGRRRGDYPSKPPMSTILRWAAGNDV